MSEEPQAKKHKKYHNFKKNLYNNQNNKKFIEPGQRGFLAMCNFKERACIRECYNILNHYADELYGPIDSKDVKKTEDKEVNNEIDEDIADDLEKEIQDAKSKKRSSYRFQVVDTGVLNCLFIKTSLDDPVALGSKIVESIAETKQQRSRHLIRLIPINIVTRAKLKDIIDAAGVLFDECFLKSPKTFSVIFNKRYNNEIKRDEIIKELAELVTTKNIKNKVDLKNAEVSIIVEIIKGLCCLSVIPGYIKYKKYNLIELASKNVQECHEEVVKSTENTLESKNENESKETDESKEPENEESANDSSKT